MTTEPEELEEEQPAAPTDLMQHMEPDEYPYAPFSNEPPKADEEEE